MELSAFIDLKEMDGAGRAHTAKWPLRLVGIPPVNPSQQGGPDDAVFYQLRQRRVSRLKVAPWRLSELASEH
jgi:hypothetical protein